jgi:pimeloyl-ACP methyl ester carboxylesterase
MQRFSQVLSVIIFFSLLVPAVPAQAQELLPPQPVCLQDVYLVEGEPVYYLVCLPPAGIPWNGELVVFAHGYIPAYRFDLLTGKLVYDDAATLEALTAQLTYQDINIPAIVTGLGYAFAATSYRANGLAVLPGVQDVVDLVGVAQEVIGAYVPGAAIVHTYLVGFSEGGLITTLAVEQHPEIFDGGLAACGPIGDFRKQINYWGDLRVLFDYFFPAALPKWDYPGAVTIPDEVISTWVNPLGGLGLQDMIAALLIDPASAGKLDQLLKTSKVPFDKALPATKVQSVMDVLWYNVFATNDGIVKLGGSPFDNRFNWYIGSTNDRLLNATIERFKPDLAALTAMKAYQTSGKLSAQLVTLHTTGDPIIPYWHVPVYRMKVLSNWTDWNYSNIPVVRYGHCNFEVQEVLAGFALLVWKTTGELPPNVLSQLPDAQSQQEFQTLMDTYAATR